MYIQDYFFSKTISKYLFLFSRYLFFFTRNCFFTIIYLTSCVLLFFVYFYIFNRVESRSDACDVESCLRKIYVYLCYYLSFSRRLQIRSCVRILENKILIKIAAYRVQSVSNVINS